ncbi:MAG: hypothetical protein ACRERD_24330 [Candidatus Binatia bacterium]
MDDYDIRFDMLYGEAPKPKRKRTRGGPVGHPALPQIAELRTFEQALAALNPQQQLFIKHFLSHGVALRAATEAGFKSGNLRLAAGRIKSNKHVAHAIALGRQEVIKKVAADGLTGAEAYVKQIEDKITKAEGEAQYNAVASLLALKGKALGLLVEKVEQTVHANGFVLQISTEIPPGQVIEHENAAT